MKHVPDGPMRAALVLAMAALSCTAVAADEGCTVKGLTARWALSYCMARSETDDEAHPDVSTCFSAELASRPSERDCDANLKYKSAICSLALERRGLEGSLAQCMDSDETIPSVVRDGV